MRHKQVRTRRLQDLVPVKVELTRSRFESTHFTLRIVVPGREDGRYGIGRN